MRQEAPAAQKAFYNSAAWNKCRAEYLSIVGGLCERCLKKGLVVPARIVHHKEYINTNNITDPSVLLSHKNLEALCQECHNEEHHKNQRRYTVDECGRVICRG